MKRASILAAGFAAVLMAGPALAQDITGNWRTQSGENATIAPCGGAFCVKLVSGPYSGRQIGRVSGSGPKYTGEITDPANDKTYSGSATVSGNSMKMTGCVARVLCRSQTWTRR